MAMKKYQLIITLNLNGLNAPIKRHRVAEWIRSHDSHICCLQETNLRTKDLHRKKDLESEGVEKKTIPSKWIGKKSWVEIVISDKIDFKVRAIKTNTEGHPS